ncbi:SGNH/GDSL hydrolase family protein, partial [Vibrio vulnificus]|nr:SGNH/GDSL hydrolase family protein [Vibrio vulnificus]
SDALNGSIVRNKNAENYNRWFGRQRTRVDDLYINCYGDSITFGQALADSDNATNKIGVDTGFGDNSQYGHWQFDKSYPVVLSDALNRSMANTVHVSNRGYSGDRVVTSYMRHRVQPQAGISTVMLGVNDCLFATSNGKNPDQISNEANPWGVNCYSVMLRRFLMREILRGNNVVLFGCINYASLIGYDGTNVAAAKLTEVYNDAAASVAAELGVYFVDTRKDIINQYDLARFTQEGTHPGELGHQVLGERFAALFVGHGYLRSMKVSSGSKLIANQAINSMNSETLMNTIPNSTSYSPPFNKSEPTVLSIPALSNGRLVFSVYCDAEDMIVYPSFIANPSTVTMELDGGAAQQEYLVDYPTYQDASFSQADSYPASVKQRTYSSQVKVNRRTVHYSDKSDMYLHITGRGWHTISFSADVGSKAFIDSLMFLSWDEVHKEITGLTASVVFDGTGGVSIKDAFNVGAVTDNGGGIYTIHFLNPMLHANYNLQTNGIVSGRELVLTTCYEMPRLTSVSIKFISAAGMGVGVDWQPIAPNHASVVIFGGR